MRVMALVPLPALNGHQIRLNALTAGQGRYSSAQLHHDPNLPAAQQQLTQEHRALDEEQAIGRALLRLGPLPGLGIGQAVSIATCREGSSHRPATGWRGPVNTAGPAGLPGPAGGNTPSKTFRREPQPF